MILSDNQKVAFNHLLTFIQDSNNDIFILRGYAGTGKTTLIKFLAAYLDSHSVSYQLLAPTGRAAKVLLDKTGKGCTIHHAIYEISYTFPQAGDKDASHKNINLVTAVKTNPSPLDMLIIDESSMIGDKGNSNNVLKFGSNRLLSDIIEFKNINNIPKIIFIGDRAQLPPVGEINSPALNLQIMSEKGWSVTGAELTEVIRQKDNPLLDLVTEMRKNLSVSVDQRVITPINANNRNIFNLTAQEAIAHYVQNYSEHTYDSQCFITYSNSNAQTVNHKIRELLFSSDKFLHQKELLIIANNNYTSYSIPIHNGDFAVVKEVLGSESRNITVSHMNVKHEVTLQFIKVVLTFNQQYDIECFILKNLLDSRQRDISVTEQKALYIDFCIRNSKAHKYKEGSKEFVELLKKDLYFNVIKAKFGYAITCHKAQGSEWEDVYVDYSGKYSLSDDSLRWCYTATTRAKTRLFAINAPQNLTFYKMNANDISKVNKAVKEYYSKSIVAESPFHSDSDMVGIRLKAIELIEKFKDTSYQLTDIEHFQYKERYHIKMGEDMILLDANYNANGIFKELNADINDTDRVKDLKTIFNKPYILDCAIEYSPSDENLKQLYNCINTLCNDIGISITNIIEDKGNYNIIYCLKTDAPFAYIQFFFKKNFLFTSFSPKSAWGDKDEKLKTLTNLITEEL